MRIIVFLTNIVLVNFSFIASFFVRYGLPFPRRNFLPFKNSFVFLTVIHVAALAFFGVYKTRFKSSWDLFQRVFAGLVLGTLLSIAFVYVFRVKWGAFPTSVFVISFFVNLVLLFKLNQLILRAKQKIRKKVVVIGRGSFNGMVSKKALVENISIDEIDELLRHTDADEIIICEQIENQKFLNLLAYFIQKSKMDVLFSPSVYLKLLPEKIDGSNSLAALSTFVGRKRDADEFLIRSLDLVGSVVVLTISLPLLALISLSIKISSPGPVLYKQKRVGKDGTLFTLYKFRTMVKDAEEVVGPVLASENDPRVIKVGKWLRRTRLDELPQLFNVLRGEMSLVGPRPERPYFVKVHRALRELRLAVRPGITGLAQIRSFYDLNPKHKIKYDYLYIQQRSFLLNLYILAKTIPVVFSKKGR